MEKRVVELEIKENTKGLRTQLKEANLELQRVAREFGTMSDEAVAAAKRVAELKDEMGDLKDFADAFNPDQKFNALSGSIGGVLSGFQAVEGGLALMGVESEDLQKTMVKLQSVMAFSEGIKGLLEAKDQFKNLGKVAVDAFKGMTTAGKAFALTGIGLLLTGIAYAMSLFGDETEDAKKEVESLTSATESLNAALEFGTKQLELSTRAKIADAKKAGATELELLQIERDALQESINLRFYNAQERQNINADIINSENSTVEAYKQANEEYYKAKTEKQLINEEAITASAEFAQREAEILKKIADEEKKIEQEKAKARKDAYDKWLAEQNKR
jgi:hypothetical protein